MCKRAYRDIISSLSRLPNDASEWILLESPPSGTKLRTENLPREEEVEEEEGHRPLSDGDTENIIIREV